MTIQKNNDDCKECLQITNDGRSAFILEDGKIIKSKDSLIGGILPQNYNAPMFPGDLADDYAKWVIDSVIAADKLYPSDFFFFLFGGPFFRALHVEDKQGIHLKSAIRSAFEQIERFSNYWKEQKGENLRILIIGTGEVVEFKGFVDLFDLISEFPEYFFMGFDGYAGIYFDNPIKLKYFEENEPFLEMGTRAPKSYSEFSEKEKKLLKKLKDIKSLERVVITSDLMKENSPISSEFIYYAPDIICKAEEGKEILLKSLNSRKLYRIPGNNLFTGYQTLNWNHTIPLKSIIDVFKSTILNLKDGPTLLAIIEAAGPSNFPHCDGKIETSWGGLPYGAGYNFIRTVNTGNSAFETPLPYGTDPHELTKSTIYPYSWGIPNVTETIGSDFFPETSNKRSIAVGARSLYTHMISNCDISIEPWVRDRIENGVFYVLNKSQIERKAKKKTNCIKK